MDEALIEVEIVETGDTAYAETPEAAVKAARQMTDDHGRAVGTSTSRFTARFSVDGRVVGTSPVKSLIL